MGLVHAGEGDNEYGDKTSVMGISTEEKHFPKRCFDGRNNHALKWYEDRELLLDPLETPRSVTTLASYVNYGDLATGTDEKVLISIPDTNSAAASKIHVQYNRAIAHNSGTGEKRMRAVISEGSTVVGSLTKYGQDTFTFANYRGSGQDLIVKLCQEVDGPDAFTYGPDAMIISIGLGNALCPELEAVEKDDLESVSPPEGDYVETSFPTAHGQRPPTASPTDASTLAPSATPSEFFEESQQKMDWFDLYNKLHNLDRTNAAP